MTRIFYASKLIGVAALGAAQMLALSGCDETGSAAEAAPMADVPNLDGVVQLAFAGKGELELRQLPAGEGAPSLQVISDEADEIEITREGDALHIRVPRSVDEAPRFVLSLPTLEVLDLSGAAKVNAGTWQVSELRIDASGATKLVFANITGDLLRVESSGASSFSFAGNVREHRLDVSGAASYDASDLRAREVQVDASGATSVKVHASEHLRLVGAGAGSIEYAGNPEVDQDTSGMFRVKHVES